MTDPTDWQAKCNHNSATNPSRQLQTPGQSISWSMWAEDRTRQTPKVLVSFAAFQVRSGQVNMWPVHCNWLDCHSGLDLSISGRWRHSPWLDRITVECLSCQIDCIPRYIYARARQRISNYWFLSLVALYESNLDASCLEAQTLSHLGSVLRSSDHPTCKGFIEADCPLNVQSRKASSIPWISSWLFQLYIFSTYDHLLGRIICIGIAQSEIE